MIADAAAALRSWAIGVITAITTSILAKMVGPPERSPRESAIPKRTIAVRPLGVGPYVGHCTPPSGLPFDFPFGSFRKPACWISTGSGA